MGWLVCLTREKRMHFEKFSNLTQHFVLIVPMKFILKDGSISNVLPKMNHHWRSRFHILWRGKRHPGRITGSRARRDVWAAKFFYLFSNCISSTITLLVSTSPTTTKGHVYFTRLLLFIAHTLTIRPAFSKSLTLLKLFLNFNLKSKLKCMKRI